MVLFIETPFQSSLMSSVKKDRRRGYWVAALIRVSRKALIEKDTEASSCVRFKGIALLL